MKDSRVAIRYAEALLDLSIDLKIDNDVFQDMIDISGYFRDHSELKALVEDPTTGRDDKERVLLAILKEAHHPTQQIIKLLCSKGRVAELPEIAVQYRILHDIKNKRQKAVVTTAAPMTESMRKEITQVVAQISGHSTLEEVVDASILGGFILQIDDKRINQSIAYKLQMLDKEFEENPYIKEF